MNVQNTMYKMYKVQKRTWYKMYYVCKNTYCKIYMYKAQKRMYMYMV